MDDEVQKEKEKTFLALAERFRAAADPDEVKRLGDQMGRFIRRMNFKKRLQTGGRFAKRPEVKNQSLIWLNLQSYISICHPERGEGSM